MDSILGKIREEIVQLQRMRDELRLQLSLGKAEVKQRWERVERSWLQIEDQLRDGDSTADAAALGLHSVLHDVRSAYEELRKEIQL
jgi:hypothetical protein